MVDEIFIAFSTMKLYRMIKILKKNITESILLHLVSQVIWPNPIPNFNNHEVIADSL